MVKDTLMPKKVVHNKKGEIMPQKKKRLFIDKIEKVMKETQTTRLVYFLSPKENNSVSIFHSLFYSRVSNKPAHTQDRPALSF